MQGGKGKAKAKAESESESRTSSPGPGARGGPPPPTYTPSEIEEEGRRYFQEVALRLQHPPPHYGELIIPYVRLLVGNNDVQGLMDFLYPHIKDDGERTILHMTSLCRSFDALKWAIENSVGRVGLGITDKEQSTPLHLACTREPSTSFLYGREVMADNPRCAFTLLRAGANPLIQDGKGNTCMHTAVLARLPRVVSMLCTVSEAGHLIQTVNNQGKTVTQLMDEWLRDAIGVPPAVALTDLLTPDLLTGAQEQWTACGGTLEALPTHVPFHSPGEGEEAEGPGGPPMDSTVEVPFLVVLAYANVKAAAVRPEPEPESLAPLNPVRNPRCFGCVASPHEPRVKIKKWTPTGEVITEEPITAYLRLVAMRPWTTALPILERFKVNIWWQGGDDGVTLLMHAARYRKTEVVAWILDVFPTLFGPLAFGVYLRMGNDRGASAIHYATGWGNPLSTEDWHPSWDDPECARLLLDAGADINARTLGMWTPLLLAARLGLPNVVRYLCSKPTLDTSATVDGNAALYLTRNDHVKRLLVTLKEFDVQYDLILKNDVVGLKCTPEATLTIHPRVGATAPQFAAYLGRPVPLAFLIRLLSEADLAGVMRNACASTQVMDCMAPENTGAPEAGTEAGKLRCVEVLLAKGLSVETLNHAHSVTGNTALHVASQSGFGTIVLALLRCPGIDPGIENSEGKRADECCKDAFTQRAFMKGYAERAGTSQTVSSSPTAQHQATLDALAAQDAMRSALADLTTKAFTLERVATEVRALCSNVAMQGHSGWNPCPSNGLPVRDLTAWATFIPTTDPSGSIRAPTLVPGADYTVAATAAIDDMFPHLELTVRLTDATLVRYPDLLRCLVAHDCYYHVEGTSMDTLLTVCLHLWPHDSDAEPGLSLMRRMHATQWKRSVLLPLAVFTALENQVPKGGFITDVLDNPLPTLDNSEAAMHLAAAELRSFPRTFTAMITPWYPTSMEDVLAHTVKLQCVQWCSLAIEAVQLLWDMHKASVCHGAIKASSWKLASAQETHHLVLGDITHVKGDGPPGCDVMDTVAVFSQGIDSCSRPDAATPSEIHALRTVDTLIHAFVASMDFAGCIDALQCAKGLFHADAPLPTAEPCVPGAPLPTSP